MATSRTYPSPVNLKERIAALQQRNVSPSQQQTSQFAAKNIPSSGPGGLRDKIAKFEEKGGIPVPRGSFAMGGPQLPENAPAKKRGELYGNRIGRPIGTPPSRPSSPLLPADGSPSIRKRCVSTGGALLKGKPPMFSKDEPAPPLPPSPSLPFGRRNSLAVDFGSIVGADKISQHTVEDCNSLSSSPSLSPSLGGGASSVVSPSQSSPEPVTPPNGPLPQDIEVLSLAAESEETELVSQGDSNLAPTTTLNMITTTSQPSQEVIPIVGATPTIENDQADGPASGELSQVPHHPALSVSGTQPLDTTLPDLPSTSPTSSPVISLERISASSYSPVPTTDSSEVIVATNTDQDRVAEPSLTFETSATEESGTISITVSHPTIQVQPSPPSPVLVTETTKPEAKRSFTAVVHRKITEMPASTAPTSTLSAPITPQTARVRRTGMTISAESSASPGYGELAVLLEEAAMLERKLTEGDNSVTYEQLQSALPTPTNSTFAPDVRSVSSSTLTEHVKAPSTESASLSEHSISIPSIREPNIGGDIPEEDEIDGRSLASTSASQRSPSHKKYLSSIRRLTSRRSSNYMPGAYPRDSISTCSEDSAAISTPSEYGDGSREGFGIAWPSVSPKKGSTGRSSSFADKLFNRNRTKSNVSTMEIDQGPIYESSTRSFTLSQPPSPSATKNSQSRQASSSPHWTISRDSSSSPAPSILDKEIFDAFPSVPQTLPTGPVHLSPDFSEAGVRRLSAAPVKGRKHSTQILSMV